MHAGAIASKLFTVHWCDWREVGHKLDVPPQPIDDLATTLTQPCICPASKVTSALFKTLALPPSWKLTSWPWVLSPQVEHRTGAARDTGSHCGAAQRHRHVEPGRRAPMGGGLGTADGPHLHDSPAIPIRRQCAALRRLCGLQHCSVRLQVSRRRGSLQAC